MSQQIQEHFVPILTALLIAWLVIRVRWQAKKLHHQIIDDEVKQNDQELAPLKSKIKSTREQIEEDEIAREKLRNEYSSNKLPPPN